MKTHPRSGASHTAGKYMYKRYMYMYVPVHKIWSWHVQSWPRVERKAVKDQPRYGIWGMLSSICTSPAIPPRSSQLSIFQTVVPYTRNGELASENSDAVCAPLRVAARPILCALCTGVVTLTGANLTPLFPCRFRNVNPESRAISPTHLLSGKGHGALWNANRSLDKTVPLCHLTAITP